MPRLLNLCAGLLVLTTAHAHFDWAGWGWPDWSGSKDTPAPTSSPTPAPTRAPGCFSTSECGEKLCIFNMGACEGPGTCKEKPSICPADFSPVCGCDGRTYTNECRAWAVGASVRFDGECARKMLEQEKQQVEEVARDGDMRCGGRMGRQSCGGAEMYCAYELGSCGLDDSEGVCRERPTICTMQYMPVCGCDGKTYGNECSARGAGVSVARAGECVGTNTKTAEDAHVTRPMPAQQQRQGGGLKGNNA